MKCSSCGTEFDGNFCPTCGQPAPSPTLPEICSRCGTSFKGRYCPSCGWPAGASYHQIAEATTWRSFLGVLWSLAIVFFIVYQAAIVVSFYLVIPKILIGIMTSTCEICVAIFFTVNPFQESLLSVVYVGGIAFLAWFLVLAASVGGLYAYLALVHGRIALKDLARPIWRVAEKARSESTLVVVGQVLMAVLFFQFVYLYLILPLIGIEARPPPIVEKLPEWYNLYSLVNAAVWEELVTRLLLIGLPLTLGSFTTRITHVLSGTAKGGTGRFLSGSFRYLIGGNLNASSPRAAKVVGGILVLASAAVFGYLHVPAWGAWKFVDAFIAGLALGYLYLRKGLAASVLMHLSVNSLGLIVSAAGGERSLVALVLVSVFYFGLVTLGSGFFLYYLREVGRLLTGSRPRRAVKVTVSSREAARVRAAQQLLFPVICPSCGGREAVYEEGTLRCSSCGSKL